MTAIRSHNIGELIDGQKVGLFNLKLLALSFVAMTIDGYDLFAAPFSAPYLIKAWSLSKADIAPVFSASLFGIMIGAAALGWLGDRAGRRMAIILGLCICGVFSVATAFADGLNSMWWLRFGTGVGLGGVMPNAISLNAEMAPKRVRAMLIILMFAGINVGGAVPGVVAAWLVPIHGWQIIYWIGGIAPLAVAACLLFLLPESLKFLALDPNRQKEALRVASRMRPDLSFDQGTRLNLDEMKPSDRKPTVSIAQLFSNGLAAVTLLLWSLFALNLMTSYLLTSWMPILLESNGIGPGQAAAANAMFQVGGVAGGIVVSLLLSRLGMYVVTAFFLLSVPAIAAIGTPSSGVLVTIVIVTIAGFCNMGLQFGLNASAGLLYPTSIRSKGVGMAFSIGRVGSILGPFAGAFLIRSGVNVTMLFILAAAPVAVGSVGALALARICSRRNDTIFSNDRASSEISWALDSH